MQPKVCFMWDIETLDTGPRSVMSQIAFQAWPTEDPDKVLARHVAYLPIQPQIVLKRTVSASTIIWWMQQNDDARERFAANTGDEFEELPALLRYLFRKVEELTPEGGEYEHWAKGPQFDIVNVESLADDLSLPVPWKYSRVRDLRTLMALAGVENDDVTRPPDMTPHMADQDCRYQILQYAEAMRRLRSRD